MDFNFISKAFLATLGGVPVTLLIMVVSILLSFFPALFLALGQIYKVKGVRSFSVIYLAFIRATHPIILILFFYSLFPSLLNSFFKSIGSHFNVFEINPIYYAFIIFSLMTTGSLAEILRSAILTVDKGQLEAAQAIGLTNRQAYIRIVFPQALRSALPNLCNLVINLVKGTSLVFVMTIKDITAIAKVEENPYRGTKPHPRFYGVLGRIEERRTAGRKPPQVAFWSLKSPRCSVPTRRLLLPIPLDFF